MYVCAYVCVCVCMCVCMCVCVHAHDHWFICFSLVYVLDACHSVYKILKFKKQACMHSLCFPRQ